MSGMKACKTCKNMIAKSAKVCPTCGAKQGTPFIFKLIGVVVLFVGLGMAFNDGAKGAAAASSKPAQEYVVGKPFFVENTIEVTVSRVEKLTTLPAIFGDEKKPSAGGIFVAVQWHISNKGKEPVKSYSIPAAELVSGDGATYKMDYDATSRLPDSWNSDAKVLSDLNPGISVDNAYVFEVSKELLGQGDWKIKIDDALLPLKYTNVK